MSGKYFMQGAERVNGIGYILYNKVLSPEEIRMQWDIMIERIWGDNPRIKGIVSMT